MEVLRRLLFVTSIITGPGTLAHWLARDEPKERCGFASPDGAYKVSWRLIGSQVRFELDAEVRNDRWTGIGFGEEMTQGDFVIFKVEDAFVSTGDYFTEGAETPKKDEAGGGASSVRTQEIGLSEGRLKVVFWRALSTGDVRDADLSPCVSFLFPTQGGAIYNGQIQIHSLSPPPPKSASRVCVRKCADRPAERTPQPGPARVLRPPTSPRPTTDPARPFEKLDPRTVLGGASSVINLDADLGTNPRAGCPKPDDAICGAWVEKYRSGSFQRWAVEHRVVGEELRRHLCRVLKTAPGPSPQRHCCNLYTSLCE